VHICLIYPFFEQASLKLCFSTVTHNRWEKALEYVKGLVTCPDRCHLTAISEIWSEVNNQVFNHFISQSPWVHRLLIKRDDARHQAQPMKMRIHFHDK